MHELVEAVAERIEAVGLRKDLKVIIGSGQMDDTVANIPGRTPTGTTPWLPWLFPKKRWGVK